MARVVGSISALKEKEVNCNRRWLDLLDDLNATLIDVNIFLLRPTPDVFTQRLEAKDSTMVARGVKGTTLACADEDIGVGGTPYRVEMNTRPEGLVISR